MKKLFLLAFIAAFNLFQNAAVFADGPCNVGTTCSLQFNLTNDSTHNIEYVKSPLVGLHNAELIKPSPAIYTLAPGASIQQVYYIYFTSVTDYVNLTMNYGIDPNNPSPTVNIRGITNGDNKVTFQSDNPTVTCLNIVPGPSGFNTALNCAILDSSNANKS